MKQAALAAVALAAVLLPGSATTAAALPAVLAFAAPEDAGGGVYVQRSGRARLLAARGLTPAWSPDGRRVAYIAPLASGSSDLYVVDAEGTHRAPLTRTPLANEVAAAWAPDGRSLVVERDGRLLIVRADGRHERSLTAGREPAWSSNGRVAFVSERAGTSDLYLVQATGKGLRRLTSSPALESEPAWSPNGKRIAFVAVDAGLTDLYVLDVQTKAVVRLTQDPGVESSPAWSPTGDSIAFVSDLVDGGPLWSVPAAGGLATSLGGPTTVGRFRWRPAISSELPPDLDQKPPSDLSFEVTTVGGRRHYLLGFTSATDNLGAGPLSIVASRPSRAVPTMRAAQRVHVAGGGARTYQNVGFLRYTVAFPHLHWHLMDFQRYELRRASDHSLVVRDRKSGFCLADHWALVPGFVPGKPPGPVFHSNCGQGKPGALSVSQGTSVGYTDRYPAFFHGQNLDVTRVPAGTYVLVHRASPDLLLRELRYENNAASLRIQLSWPRGRAHAPAVRMLAACPGSEWCAG
jgi:WD40-like Beta Propeller Repeat/Lysyl oxidase